LQLTPLLLSIEVIADTGYGSAEMLNWRVNNCGDRPRDGDLTLSGPERPSSATAGSSPRQQQQSPQARPVKACAGLAVSVSKFHLAAIVQNLRKLAKLIPAP
jgi:hypothetical protein